MGKITVMDNKKSEPLEHNSSSGLDLPEKALRKLKNLEKYKPEYVRALISHMKDEERSFGSFSRVVGVDNRALYDWLEEYPEFKAVREKYRKRKAKLYE